MTKLFNKLIACLVALGLISGYIMPLAHAAEITDEAVLAVIDQLTAIDTLQTIQNKRAQYTASGHYDITTTSQKVIDRHNNARIGYETYVELAFSARLAAQQAYDALTPEQQAQIDPALVAKLDNKLDTVFHTATFPVTPADNEYTFEAVDGGLGYGYEVSNHMVSSNIPQTFVLVNTSDGATSWTPNGRYEYGKSNYDVAYCCDVQTNLSYSSHYKRINLEDSAYYSEASAKHIRAIVMNSYPFVSMDEMKTILKDDGLNAEFVDSLTRADMIAAVQQAIWTYANAGEEWNNVGYFATIDVPSNNGIYFTALHDYTNECWEWFPGTRTRSYRADAAYRVNNLAYYLCTLEGYDAAAGEIIITDVDVTRASLLADANDTYELGMYVHLNTGATAGDNLNITVISRDADGNITGKSGHAVESAKTYELGVTARFGDTITVCVEGTQHVGRSVYFYEPEGGRDSSQCLVGVGGGPTRVRAEESFVFNTDIEQGIRIYKTDSDTGLPISDITFDLYKVTLPNGETVGETPTDDEIAKYVIDSSKVGSIVTDVTGYASFPLDDGVYIAVERHNADKVKAPIGPFFVKVPMRVETSDPKNGVTVEHIKVVSVYPKNEALSPDTDDPQIPSPPGEVTGSFTIIKHDVRDKADTLSGASFEVYRTAKADDTDTRTIICKGTKYTVSAVITEGAPLVLTTDENGKATSPKLPGGVYFLIETKAPDGYNTLAEAVPVTVRSDLMDEAEVVYIANYPGELLPSTGGRGTKWIFIIGGAITAIAALLLINERKMRYYE